MRTRSVEMFLATTMTCQGAIFLAPGDTMRLSHYEVLRQWVEIFPGTEAAFGAIILAVGLARWGALIVNGYWSPTPGIRIAGCAVGCLYWMTLTLSFLEASPIFRAYPAALAWTLTAVAFEIYSSARSAIDAHNYDTFGLRQRARRAAGGVNGNARNHAPR